MTTYAQGRMAGIISMFKDKLISRERASEMLGLSDAISNIYSEAVRIHSDAFKRPDEARNIVRRKDGGYLCCGYCGTGWEEEAGSCVACGAPAGDALKEYLDMLKDEYDNRPQGVYVSLGYPMAASSEGMGMMTTTDMYMGNERFTIGATNQW